MSDEKKEEVTPKELTAEEYIFLCKRIADKLKTILGLEKDRTCQIFIETTNSVYYKLQAAGDTTDGWHRNGVL